MPNPAHVQSESNQAHATLAMTVLLAVMTSIGCATPQPVLRLTPAMDNLVWVGGNAVATHQGKNARVAIAFMHEQDGLLAFRVEIDNHTPVPLLMDPARFSYTTCRLASTPEKWACKGPMTVTDPEKALLDLDLGRARDKAENENAQAFAVGMMLLEVTAGMAGAGTGKPNMALAGAAGMGLAADVAASAEGTENRQMTSYDFERAKWSTEALRKSTLFPGKQVGGMVYINRDLNAGEVRLFIQVGDERFAFPFQQLVIYPKPRVESTRGGVL